MPERRAACVMAAVTRPLEVIWSVGIVIAICLLESTFIQHIECHTACKQRLHYGSELITELLKCLIIYQDSPRCIADNISLLDRSGIKMATLEVNIIHMIKYTRQFSGFFYLTNGCLWFDLWLLVSGYTENISI